ncbi:glutamate receptor ionotropic, NMDA 3A-like [Saccoglossus kowalevskii]|uniref:Glutamate receptor ionotropic, NMDA 3A-like n=1 Tax=Saccoglossus kowalevskii TaxID=10224 RepID=A0ABM0GNW1_SACKO|nr:PREDICTED: glutamate receptor ionotropic, NMDA 3A-like [Saccoglossus kowalevskii]
MSESRTLLSALLVCVVFAKLLICSAVLNSPGGQLPNQPTSNQQRRTVLLGALFGEYNRDYVQALNDSVREINRDALQYPNISLSEVIAYSGDNPENATLELCEEVVSRGVSAILTVSDQITTFTLSLVGAFVGIPVLGFGSGYAVLSDKELHPTFLRMEPPLAMQSHPVVDILKRNNWYKFSIIYDDDPDGLSFIRELWRLTDDEEWEIEAFIKIPMEYAGNISSRLTMLTQLNSKVIVLQVSPQEAARIFRIAENVGMLSAGYAWILTGMLTMTDPTYFPVGLIAVNNSASTSTAVSIKNSVRLVAKAMQKMVSESTVAIPSPPDTCWRQDKDKWLHGHKFFRYLKEAVLKRPEGMVSFNSRGDINEAQYDILNLRMGEDLTKTWVNVGSWTMDDLNINSILWPGQTEIMPNLASERRKLRVVTILEEPFLFISELEGDSRECYSGGLCLGLSLHPSGARTTRKDVIDAFEHWRSHGTFSNNMTDDMPRYAEYCCTGMAYDVLEMLSRDMNFDYDLYIVADGNFGSIDKGEWNGMVGDLINGAAEMAVGSFSINSARSQVIDFSAPFYYTSLGIVTARRKGTAAIGSFMEPLEWTMWLGIFITLHATAFFTTIFEWHSPYGLTPRGRNRPRVFSFPSALTLCWSILFSHTVPTKSPKCWASRFLINLWAIFSLVFIASYTANLAAFMVGEKQPNEISGINDPKLQQQSKGFRAATIASSSPESFLTRSYPALASKIAKYAVANTSHGVDKLRNRQLEAFIWDSAILEYTISSDPKCELQLVGKPFASEGYGIGLPKNSPLTSEVSLHIYKYSSAGYLEQLQRQWYNRVGCSKKQGLVGESTLDLSHFIGVFILLCTGVVIASLTLILEWFVERILLPKWRKDAKKLNWLPFTQRLHRAVHTPSVLHNNTYTARGQQIPLRNIGSRLCEHRNRRDSGEVSYDISKYLTMRYETAPLLNNKSFPVVKRKAKLPLKQVNIAVQTDIDEKVNSQLMEVDANISKRIQQFENDLRHMREALARALKEKEHLLRRLSKFENINKNGNSNSADNSLHGMALQWNARDSKHDDVKLDCTSKADNPLLDFTSFSSIPKVRYKNVLNEGNDNDLVQPVNFKPNSKVFKPRPSLKDTLYPPPDSPR